MAIPLQQWLGDERPWVAHAACRGADPSLFFAEAVGAGGEVALRICGGCPVQSECLEWALTAHASFGIWGGTTEQDRRRLVRRSA